MNFEIDAETELLKLEDELASRTYSPLPSTCFVTESPKIREIFAADFRDRVVHHLLVSYLEPKWEPKFIYDSYACRKKKGVHAAVKRLKNFMLKAGHNGSCPAFFLQIDVRSFFISINKKILFKILNKKENNPEISWLLEKVIFNDPAEDPVKKGLEEGKAKRMDKFPRFSNFGLQYRWFSNRYREYFLFFQVGRYYEFYGNRVNQARELFPFKHGDNRPRLGKRVGFPVFRLGTYLKKALNRYDKIMVVQQNDRVSGRLMERRIRSIIIPDKFNQENQQ
ncbi:hypothetical protein QUF76_11260 [Desulfobacterales bacterium HSG16]|nr:hypothetical protein [Desulfobacterales bacterium HSG16]